MSDWLDVPFVIRETAGEQGAPSERGQPSRSQAAGLLNEAVNDWLMAHPASSSTVVESNGCASDLESGSARELGVTALTLVEALLSLARDSADQAIALSSLLVMEEFDRVASFGRAAQGDDSMAMTATPIGFSRRVLGATDQALDSYAVGAMSSRSDVRANSLLSGALVARSLGKTSIARQMRSSWVRERRALRQVTTRSFTALSQQRLSSDWLVEELQASDAIEHVAWMEADLRDD